MTVGLGVMGFWMDYSCAKCGFFWHISRRYKPGEVDKMAGDGGGFLLEIILYLDFFMR